MYLPSVFSFFGATWMSQSMTAKRVRRLPAVCSSVCTMAYPLSPLLQPMIERFGVVVCNLPAQLVRQVRRERLLRRVPLPVRPVAREEDQLVRAHLLDDPEELDHVRRVDRLERPAHVAAHVFGRRVAHPGDLAPQALPLLVHAPH